MQCLCSDILRASRADRLKRGTGRTCAWPRGAACRPPPPSAGPALPAAQPPQSQRPPRSASPGDRPTGRALRRLQAGRPGQLPNWGLQPQPWRRPCAWAPAAAAPDAPCWQPPPRRSAAACAPAASAAWCRAQRRPRQRCRGSARQLVLRQVPVPERMLVPTVRVVFQC